MSGSTTRRSRAIGVSAAGALLLALVPVGAAHAAKAPVVPRYASVGRPSVAAHFTPAAVTPATASLCKIKGLTPAVATVGASVIDVEYTPKVSGCVLSERTWSIDFGVDSQGNEIIVGNSAGNFTGLKFTPSFLRNTDADTASPGVVTIQGLTSGEADASKTETFVLVRRSTWGTTFNAAPEPVKKGKKITLKGALTRVSWTGAKKPPYVPYSGRSVQVQFKASGAKAYTTVKTVTSVAGGKVSTTVTASKTGTWRLHYGGNSVTAAANSTGDSVKVS